MGSAEGLFLRRVIVALSVPEPHLRARSRDGAAVRPAKPVDVNSQRFPVRLPLLLESGTSVLFRERRQILLSLKRRERKLFSPQGGVREGILNLAVGGQKLEGAVPGPV